MALFFCLCLTDLNCRLLGCLIHPSWSPRLLWWPPLSKCFYATGCILWWIYILMDRQPFCVLSVSDRHEMAFCWPQGKALWDPTREDCFVMSTLRRPCKIKVFHESGEPVHVIDSPDHLSRCSVMAFHPSRRALLGGDFQGRLHVIA